MDRSRRNASVDTEDAIRLETAYHRGQAASRRLPTLCAGATQRPIGVPDEDPQWTAQRASTVRIPSAGPNRRLHAPGSSGHREGGSRCTTMGPAEDIDEREGWFAV